MKIIEKFFYDNQSHNSPKISCEDNEYILINNLLYCACFTVG
jgi:hypothetical protein